MISQAVEDRVIDQVEAITDVTVHIDPEDDENAPTCRGLPLRAEALGALETAWDQVQAVPPQREIRLHYLGGRIDVELILPLGSFIDPAATTDLAQRLQAATNDLPWFGDLRILYS